MQKINVEAFVLGWNEGEIIRFTLKHYLSFCSKVTLFDNFSSDGTDAIAEGMGANVIKFGRQGELNDAEYLKIKNHCWKRSRADFVIVVDCDEILEPPTDLDCTIYKTQGFNVYSHSMPVHSFDEIKTGVYDDNYSKLCCFNPKAITDINYSYGCHVANPKGNLFWSEDYLTLFHYRAIGGPDRLVRRHEQYRKRLGYLNKQLGLGSHYNYEDERRIKEWNEFYAKSRTYSPDGF
jgi:glycosyltransferase involved in cell wall biosynthesis